MDIMNVKSGIAHLEEGDLLVVKLPDNIPVSSKMLDDFRVKVREAIDKTGRKNIAVLLVHEDVDVDLLPSVKKAPRDGAADEGLAARDHAAEVPAQMSAAMKKIIDMDLEAVARQTDMPDVDGAGFVLVPLAAISADERRWVLACGDVQRLIVIRFSLVMDRIYNHALNYELRRAVKKEVESVWSTWMAL